MDFGSSWHCIWENSSAKLILGAFGIVACLVRGGYNSDSCRVQLLDLWTQGVSEIQRLLESALTLILVIFMVLGHDNSNTLQW